MNWIAGLLRQPAAALPIAVILALVGIHAFAAATGGDGISTGTVVTAGRFEWRTLDPGFEVTEMPVLGDGQAVDQIALARIDPAKFRFTLRSDPAGHTLDEWRIALGAVLVINGSFFAKDGTPDTPFLSEKRLLGPADYQARHGAFVSSPDFTGIRDLRKQDWREAFRDADNAMVSFPLLLGADGGNSVQPSDKRASRSFAGQDRSGRILLGTTHGAAFPLNRLAEFLKASPLDLDLALNLDGGPFACQAIAFKGFARYLCGMQEITTGDDGGTPAAAQAGDRGRLLPVVLGVVPR